MAEKFHAMVSLGMSNSRMKDFYDLFTLARRFAFDGRTLARALLATFQRRRTSLPVESPIALTAEFSGDEGKQKQWQAFLRKNKLSTQGADLPQVIPILYDFLMPVAHAAAAGQIFETTWPEGGPWVVSPPG